MELITLEQAREAGLHRFFTGVPCKHGHIAERYVSGKHMCCTCKIAVEKRWYDRHQAAVLEYRTKLRAEPQHREKQRENHKQWVEENEVYHKQQKHEWYQDNKEYANGMRKKSNNRPSRMLAEAKGRAKKSGMEFDITIDDIIIPDVCPVLGIPIVLTNTVMCDTSPSLDRVDNTKGYIKGNVCVISMKANALKKNGSVADFEAIVAYMKQFIKE